MEGWRMQGVWAMIDVIRSLHYAPVMAYAGLGFLAVQGSGDNMCCRIVLWDCPVGIVLWNCPVGLS